MKTTLNRKIPKREKALAVAFNLIKEACEPERLREHIFDTIGYESVKKVAMAIDPDAAKLEEVGPWIARTDAIEAKLDEEGKKLFLEYDDDWCSREYFRGVSAFYLGFAIATLLRDGASHAIRRA